MNFPIVEAGELTAKNKKSLNPANYEAETFELYSVPAFDNHSPEVVTGEQIGSTKQLVQANDVLLCKIVPHIRRAWVVGNENGYRKIASSEWIIFRNKMFYPDFLKHFLVSNRFHAQLMQTVSGVGGSLLRARPKAVEKLKIPLPPLSEQKRIAAILDKADAIRQKRRQSLELCDQFIRSVFLDMFGDPVTNPKGWKVVELGQYLSCIDSGWSPKCDDKWTEENQWGVLELGGVTSGEYLPEKAKPLPKALKPKPHIEVKMGDVLFSRKNTRDLVAACVYVAATPKRIMLPDTIFRPQSNKDHLLNEYLWGLLSAKNFRRNVQALASGSAGSMPNISKAKLLHLKIPLPPIQFQEKFAKILLTKNSVKCKIKNSTFDSENLFNAVVQCAFSGKL